MARLDLDLNERELARLLELSKLRNRRKSTIAKELMNFGWEFLMIKSYKNGDLSLGTLSKKLELSMSETLDRLAVFGIAVPIQYDDYLKSLKHLKKLKKYSGHEEIDFFLCEFSFFLID